MPRLAKNEFPSDIHFIDSDQLRCRWLVFWKVLCRTLVLELYTGYWTRSKEVLLDVELISLPSSQKAGLPCRESLAQGCLFCSLVSHLAADAIQSRQKSRITGQRLSFLFSGFTSGCRCDPVAPKVKNHRPTAVFSVLWFHIWLQMRSSRAKSQESPANGCLFCSLVSHLAADAIQSCQQSRITCTAVFSVLWVTSGCRCDPVVPTVKLVLELKYMNSYIQPCETTCREECFILWCYNIITYQKKEIVHLVLLYCMICFIQSGHSSLILHDLILDDVMEVAIQKSNNPKEQNRQTKNQMIGSKQSWFFIVADHLHCRFEMLVISLSLWIFCFFVIQRHFAKLGNHS